MANIGKLWAGRVFGTNTGKLFIEFTETEPTIKGLLRFMDDNFGLTVYEISATYADKLKITGTPKQAAENVSVGDLTAEAELTPQGNLRGKWETSIGTGGTFDAYPHDIASSDSANNPSNLPEQIHLKHIELGYIRLFAEDIQQLFLQIKQDFSAGRLIVTYNAHGSEITKYAEDFLRDAANLQNLAYLKVNIQEPDVHGINRVIVIELRARGSNDIRVQGVQESWVMGAAERLASFLRRYESTPITAYKKFGLYPNQLIFLAMLVAMPSIDSVWHRAVFVFLVVIFLSILSWFHTRYIPNAYINMAQKKPNWVARYWPRILSWVMGIVGTVTGGLILYLLTHPSS